MGPAASIRPTALGVKGALLFVALELAFFATDYSNLFFLMLAFSAALGGLGAWWSWQNLRGVQVSSLQLRLAAAGSPRPVDVRLAAGAKPRFDVAVELRLADGHAEIAHAPVLHRGDALRGELAPRPRGVEQIEWVRLTSRFPFGLLRVSRRVALRAELVTYPTPSPGSGAEADGRRRADRGRPSPGRGDSIASLRPFRDGDAVADVSWRATARRGCVVVHERERDRQACVELIVDRRAPHAALEQALSRAAALTLAARRDAPVRIVSQGGDWTVGAERGRAEDALRWLAACTPLPQDAAAPTPDLRRGSSR